MPPSSSSAVVLAALAHVAVASASGLPGVAFVVNVIPGPAGPDFVVHEAVTQSGGADVLYVTAVDNVDGSTGTTFYDAAGGGLLWNTSARIGPMVVAGGVVLDGSAGGARSLASGAVLASCAAADCGGLSGDGTVLVSSTKLAGPPCAYVVAQAVSTGALLWNVSAGAVGGGGCVAGWTDAYGTMGALVPTTVQRLGTSADVFAMQWISPVDYNNDIFGTGLAPATGASLWAAATAGVFLWGGCAWVQPGVMLCEGMDFGPGLHGSGAYTVVGGTGAVVAHVRYWDSSVTCVDPTGRFFGVVECNENVAGCAVFKVYGVMPALNVTMSVSIPNDMMMCSNFVWSRDGTVAALLQPSPEASGSFLLQAFSVASQTPSSPLWNRTLSQVPSSCYPGVPMTTGPRVLLVALPGTPTSVTVLDLATGATREQIDLGVAISALTASELPGRVYASCGQTVVAVNYA